MTVKPTMASQPVRLYVLTGQLDATDLNLLVLAGNPNQAEALWKDYFCIEEDETVQGMMIHEVLPQTLPGSPALGTTARVLVWNLPGLPNRSIAPTPKED